MRKFINRLRFIAAVPFTMLGWLGLGVAIAILPRQDSKYLKHTEDQG